MEYLLHVAHALVSPVNCLAHYGNDLLVVTGQFVQCVGGNLVNITTTVTSVIPPA